MITPESATGISASGTPKVHPRMLDVNFASNRRLDHFLCRAGMCFSAKRSRKHMSAPIKASFNRELANEADLSMSRASPVDSANTAEDRRLSESQGNQL